LLKFPEISERNFDFILLVYQVLIFPDKGQVFVCGDQVQIQEITIPKKIIEICSSGYYGYALTGRNRKGGRNEEEEWKK
jgi:hypothetical protein